MKGRRGRFEINSMFSHKNFVTNGCLSVRTETLSGSVSEITNSGTALLSASLSRTTITRTSSVSGSLSISGTSGTVSGSTTRCLFLSVLPSVFCLNLIGTLRLSRSCASLLKPFHKKTRLPGMWRALDQQAALESQRIMMMAVSSCRLCPRATHSTCRWRCGM